MTTKDATLAQRASTHTLFGQLRYLGSVTDKLYKNKVFSGRDVENLTEEQFFEMLGRIRPNVRDTLKSRIQEMGLHFRL